MKNQYSADINGMATDQISTLPPPPTGSIKVQATELVKQYRPELSNGDIIKLIVRSIGNNNQGLLYYRGLLIPAMLPENLNPGDTIQAKVGMSGDQLKLQILETISKSEKSLLATLGKIPQLTTQISNELNQLLKEIKVGLSQGTLPNPPRSLTSTETLIANTAATPTKINDTALGQTKTPFVPNTSQLIPIQQLLVATIPDEGPLVQSEQVLNQLKQITDPAVLERIKQSIVQFRANVADVDLKSADVSTKIIAKLVVDLKNLLDFNRGDDKFQPDQIKRLILTILDESKKIPTKLTPKGAASLEAEIAPELAKIVIGDKLAARSAIVHIEKFIETVSTGIQLAQGSMQQLKQFEQLIESQQRLLTLNPLLHTLGEPAFILFPFLVQGLLKHSEVTISPPSPDEVDGDEANGERTKNYQRVSLTVPLTNLGNIVVELAHRPGEVLIRFSVRDQQVKDYLTKRIEELETALGSRGFGALEYWISVDGDTQTPHPIFNSPLFLSTGNDSVY